MNNSGTLETQADQAASAGRFASARQLLEQAVEADGARHELWLKLSAMRKASGDLPGARLAIDQALLIAPLDFAALLARAVILDNLQDPDAGTAYQRALDHAPKGEAVPPELQGAVTYARKRTDEYRQTLERYLTDSLPADSKPEERARAARFISNRSRRTRHFHQEPADFHFPGMPEIEFHDRGQFTGIRELEQATDVILAEFNALIAAEAAEMVPYIQSPERLPMAQWEQLNNSRKWTAVHLLQNGFPIAANVQHCPQTMAALARLDQPQVPGASPVAMFSMLAPRTHIPPHKGVTNTRLVCHLPLIVPPDCGIRVGATTRGWRIGEAIIFDDSIEHEAWNNSGEIRVVLIVDLWPPALAAGDRPTVAAVIGATNANFLASRREGSSAAGNGDPVARGS
jgi:hypothetical protein